MQDFLSFVTSKDDRMPIDIAESIILRARKFAQGTEMLVSYDDVDVIMNDPALACEFRKAFQIEAHH